MKGSVPRPPRPAPAVKTVSHPASTNSPPGHHNTLEDGSEKPIDPSNQITLSVLEEFTAARAKGYDPYNTPTAQRPPHSWERGRKRD